MNTRRTARLLRRLAERACPPGGPVRLGGVSLVLTDDLGIREINRRYLGRADSTDVISFRYDPSPASPGIFEGEIFVNVQRAVEAGPAHGGTCREFALYAAHGCDHLAGEDDGSPAERARMRRRELRWLAEAAELGLLRGLVSPGARRGGRSRAGRPRPLRRRS